jgi:hypothetical protein
MQPKRAISSTPHNAVISSLHSIQFRLALPTCAESTTRRCSMYDAVSTEAATDQTQIYEFRFPAQFPEFHPHLQSACSD